MNQKKTARIDMPLSRHSFLLICSEITGYSDFELESTGLVDVLATEPDTPERQAAVDEALRPPSLFWPVISALVSLWYLGTWIQLLASWYTAVGLPLPGPSDAGRTHVPSQLAHIEQLSYRAAFPHAPRANPTAFASWSEAPI
jgi:hypothetical protein